MSLLDGLIAYYKLDGNANDELGNYNGTAINVSWVDGKIDKAGSFNGSNSKTTLGSLRLDDRSFSISFWASNTRASSSYSFVIGQDASSSGKSLHMGRRSNGKFTFAFYGDDLDSPTNMATDGTWEHWVCTFDNSNRARKIYRNGVLNASDTSSNKFTGTAQLNIGYAATSWWFKGGIDEVAIYDRALTPQEISKLYNSGDGLSYPFTKGMSNIFIGGKKVTDIKLGSKQIKEVYKGDKLIWSIGGSNKMDAGLKSGLIAYYTLDGDANDSLGANNGTASNVSWVAGKIGNSASANGSNSKIALPAFGTLNKISISLWFKTSQTSCGDMIIVGNYGAGDNRNIDIVISDPGYVGKFCFSNWVTSSKILTSTKNINDGNWHHAVCIKDGSMMYLYIDGALDKSGSAHSQDIVSVASGTKMLFHPNNQRNYNGLLDEVGIWNRVLTQEEITKLYNNGNGLTY